MTSEKRSPLEEITDRLLVLYLLDKIQPCSDLGDTKLQKLIFLSELEMIKNYTKGFDFYFFKFLHGPFSKQLEEDLAELQELGLYLADEHILTSHGRRIAKWFGELWTKNEAIVSHIDRILDSYGGFSLRELLTIVYSLPHPFYKDRRLIADLKKHTPILFKVPEEKARTRFEISESDLETLDILLDEEQYREIIFPEEDEETKSVPYPGV